jgi:hypothetical protein
MRDIDMLGICLSLRMDMKQDEALFCVKLRKKLDRAKCLRFSPEESRQLQKIYDKVVEVKYNLEPKVKGRFYE